MALVCDRMPVVLNPGGYRWLDPDSDPARPSAPISRRRNASIRGRIALGATRGQVSRGASRFNGNNSVKPVVEHLITQVENLDLVKAFQANEGSKKGILDSILRVCVIPRNANGFAQNYLRMPSP